MQFAITTAIALLSLASSGAFAATPQCNQGGNSFSCKDAQAACISVSPNPIKFKFGETSMQVGGFGSAQVWLTRAASSKTTDDCNALCNQIVDSCCANGDGTMEKSTIPLQSGEQGSVQIIPA